MSLTRIQGINKASDSEIVDLDSSRVSHKGPESDSNSDSPIPDCESRSCNKDF